MNKRDEHAVVTLPITALRAHPGNCNVMSGEAFAKLKAHLSENDRYPPVIVRKITAEDNYETYELLDGHHRVRALRELGRQTVRCVVWDADDDEAAVLLATLNRLRGRDDPRKRAALLASLSERFDRKALLNRLPESPEKLKRLLALHERPAPALRPPATLGEMPVAVHFFLLPEQKKALDQTLNAIGGTREEALLRLLDRHARGVCKA